MLHQSLCFLTTTTLKFPSLTETSRHRRRIPRSRANRQRIRGEVRRYEHAAAGDLVHLNM
jgi:hypothetical protein